MKKKKEEQIKRNAPLRTKNKKKERRSRIKTDKHYYANGIIVVFGHM